MRAALYYVITVLVLNAEKHRFFHAALTTDGTRTSLMERAASLTPGANEASLTELADAESEHAYHAALCGDVIHAFSDAILVTEGTRARSVHLKLRRPVARCQRCAHSVRPFRSAKDALRSRVKYRRRASSELADAKLEPGSLCAMSSLHWCHALFHAVLVTEGTQTSLMERAACYAMPCPSTCGCETCKT